MCVLHAAAAVSAINPMMAPGGSHSQGPPECRVNAYALCPITVIPVSQSSRMPKTRQNTELFLSWKYSTHLFVIFYASLLEQQYLDDDNNEEYFSFKDSFT